MKTSNNLEEQKIFMGTRMIRLPVYLDSSESSQRLKIRKYFTLKMSIRKYGLTKLKKINCQAFALEMVIKHG